MNDSVIITIDEHNGVQVLVNSKKPPIAPNNGAVISIEGRNISIIGPSGTMNMKLPSSSDSAYVVSELGSNGRVEAGGMTDETREEDAGRLEPSVAEKLGEAGDKDDLMERIEGMSRLTASQRKEVLQGMLAMLQGEKKTPSEKPEKAEEPQKPPESQETHQQRWRGYNGAWHGGEQTRQNEPMPLNRRVAAG